jgi:hypothetical protein
VTRESKPATKSRLIIAHSLVAILLPERSRFPRLVLSGTSHRTQLLACK